MSDPSTHFKPLDPGRINPIDPFELEYWARELHCTEAELAKAVSEVGEHITSIRDYLESHH